MAPSKPSNMSIPYTSYGDSDLPYRLAECLNDWREKAPHSQFQQYGPLNMFLVKKFDAEFFLVKPQGLLRPMLKPPPQPDVEVVQEVMTGVPDPAANDGTIETFMNQLGLRHKPARSVDSYGEQILLRCKFESVLTSNTNMPVVSGQDGRGYPDFIVTAYRDLIPDLEEFAMPPGAVGHSRQGRDAVRLVVEISSTLGRDELTESKKIEIGAQIMRYLRLLGEEGERWKNYVAGIVISGNRFFAVEPDPFGDFELTPRITQWFDLNSDQFISIIDRARNLNTHL